MLPSPSARCWPVGVLVRSPVSNGFPGETEGMCLVSPEIQKFVLLLLVKP